MATPLDSDGQLEIELLRECLHALRHAIDQMDNLLDRSIPAEQILRKRDEHHQLFNQIDDLLGRSIAAERALHEREERYRLLVEGVRDYAIFMLDATGHIISWNAGAERIKGYTADEIIGRHFSIFYPADDIHRDKPATELKIAVEQGQYKEEGWRIRKDGSLFWASVLITALYDANGQLRGFGKVTRDMSERKRAEEALRQSEERFRLLVEGVRDYAIFMLDAQGYITSWNTGAQLIKGYSADEILGRHFSIFYPLEDVAAGKPEQVLQLASAEGRYEQEGWRVRKDGSLFWANVLMTALYDADGQLCGFGKVTRDMTEQRRAAAEREQLREHEVQLRLEQESRKQMEALVRLRDEFLTVASHELRTPLTALLGNAQLLQRHAQRTTVFSQRDHRSVDVIVDQASRLNRMVVTLLDLSRLQMGQMTLERAPLDLGALARRVVEEVRPTNKMHTIDYIGPDAPLMIDGDALRLEQVLQNLVQNAIKYSPAGGPVRVQVEGHANMVSLAVADEGIGIPAGSLPQLFQRFYRATNANSYISGLGIGLYVVKEIVSHHGGRIEVASVEGQGSTFTVWLPVLGHTLEPRDPEA
jgi:PAS domain S-box-containing protein